MTSQFRNLDTKRADGVYLKWERIETSDDTTSPDDYDCYDAEQLEAWRRGDWHFVGIQARAHILIVRNGHGIMHTMTSAGLWGIESDSGEYLAEVFEEEKLALLQDIQALGTLPVIVD